MAKTRIHELAKELGVTSKEVLARLNADGEFPRSASSTVEAPVARRLRESFGRTNPGRKSAGSEDLRRTKGVTPASPKVVVIKQAARPLLGSRAAIGKFNKKVAEEERRRDSTGDRTLLKHPKTQPSARDEKQAQVAVPAAESSDHKGAADTLGRNRTGGLPAAEAMMNVEHVADIVAGRTLRHDRETIVARLQELTPHGSDGYGYITWRYAASRSATTAEPRLTTAHQDLVVLSIVIDHEKQLLDSLVRDCGPILAKPGRARSGLDTGFRALAADVRGNTVADELRRARAAFEFLRRAVVLTIANPSSDQDLWNVVGWIQSASRKDRVETSTQLERADRRLAGFSASVERLLRTDDANLDRFFHHSRAHLVSLQLKRYDFLRPFRDSAAGFRPLSRQVSADLTFEVLPQGEQLRKFLGEMRASRLYGGHRVDEHRLTVLVDLQRHFGAARCVWHKGAQSGAGVDGQYLVLVIKSPNGVDENAVAISPLAGRHATYVVRHDCAQGDWRTLLAHPKFEARLLGARKLLFTTSTRQADQYSAMRDKIIKLLECRPSEFRR